MDKITGNSKPSVESRIDSIKEQFVGMEITPYSDDEGNDTMLVSVIVKLPESWDIYEDDNAKNFEVGVNKAYDVEYSGGEPFRKSTFIVDMSYGIDRVFQAVTETIRKNREMEEKRKIYQEKVDELKKMYENSINELTKMFNDQGRDINYLREVKCDSFSRKEEASPVKMPPFQKDTDKKPSGKPEDADKKGKKTEVEK